MSRITHTEITITKNPMLKVPVVVPQWEAHVLLALWGDDAQVTGTQVIDRVLPETNDEFTRLANKYGPRDEDIPFVARVYGSFGPGLRGLAKEFEASLASSRVESVVGPDNAEPLEIDRRAFAEVDAKKDAAPAVLAGFDGSRAPTPPVDLDAPNPAMVADAVAAADAEVGQIVIPADAKVAELKIVEPGVDVTLATQDERPLAEGAEVQADTGDLTEAQIDAIANVDSLAGNKIDGVEAVDFVKSDVSDLTGGDDA